MGSRVTRTSGVLVTVLMALSPVLVACGGDEEPEAEPTPSESTTSATPSPSPTKTEEPLSEFEDEPQVKAMRKWAVRAGRAVNKGQQSMRATRPWATPNGVAAASAAYADDLDNGYTWPGPQPFTPIRVRADGGSATVLTCYQIAGWSVDPKTDEPVRKRSIVPAVFELRRVDGRWKVDTYHEGSADCSNVKVKGVTW